MTRICASPFFSFNRVISQITVSPILTLLTILFAATEPIPSAIENCPITVEIIVPSLSIVPSPASHSEVVDTFIPGVTRLAVIFYHSLSRLGPIRDSNRIALMLGGSPPLFKLSHRYGVMTLTKM